MKKQLLTFALLAGSTLSALSQISPAKGYYGSAWVNGTNNIGRLDFTSPTTARFTKTSTLTVGGVRWNSYGFNKRGYVVTDIAWDQDYSAMYGIAVRIRSSSTTYSSFFKFDPDTGTGSFIGQDYRVEYGAQSNTINSLGYDARGNLHTAFDDKTDFYTMNESTGELTSDGSLGSYHYGAGDVAALEGKTYQTVTTGISGSGGTRLLEVDLDNPSNSRVVADLSSTVSKPYGLAAIEGVGLYVFDAESMNVFKVDVESGALSQVTITGEDRTYFGGFWGATAAPPAHPVPEASVSLLLGLAGFSLLVFRRR